MGVPKSAASFCGPGGVEEALTTSLIGFIAYLSFLRVPHAGGNIASVRSSGKVCSSGTSFIAGSPGRGYRLRVSKASCKQETRRCASDCTPLVFLVLRSDSIWVGCFLLFRQERLRGIDRPFRLLDTVGGLKEVIHLGAVIAVDAFNDIARLPCTALFTQSGSHRRGLPSPIRSAFPSRRISSAKSGMEVFPAVITGVEYPAFRRAFRSASEG
jgi:hypothetical protein